MHFRIVFYLTRHVRLNIYSTILTNNKKMVEWKRKFFQTYSWKFMLKKSHVCFHTANLSFVIEFKIWTSTFIRILFKQDIPRCIFETKIFYSFYSLKDIVTKYDRYKKMSEKYDDKVFWLIVQIESR